MSKQLLREWIALDYKPELIKESREKNGGKLIMQGIIQKCDTENQNKRIYPENILRREIENYQKAVRENRAVGELDHPESSSVSLKNVSHVIREMWWDGQSVMGRVEILPTPQGKVLESIIESGVTIGISSRGVGSTEKGRTAEKIIDKLEAEGDQVVFMEDELRSIHTTLTHMAEVKKEAQKEISDLKKSISGNQKRLELYGFKVYSQNDEDGILEEIFKRIGIENGTFCEIGVENGLECNTLYLIHKGWIGS